MLYIEPFLAFIQFEKRYSMHTVKSYRNDLEQFYAFLLSNSDIPELHLVDHKLIRNWMINLIGQNINERSIQRKISTLKSFYKYLQREGHIENSPVEKVVPPKSKKRLPEFVENDNLDKLLDIHEFGDDFEGRRNKLIIELFYLTGMRRVELINLKVDDLNVKEKGVKVMGKRNKERIIPFSKTIIPLVDSYLAERDSLDVDSGNDYFFLTKKGNKIYDKLVYRIVNKYLQLVTTIEKKSPHILRHSFATHMLNNGADLNAIKELLGHSNLAATQIYTHNSFEKLKNIYKQSHPRA